MNGIPRKVVRNDDEFDIKKIVTYFLDHWKLYVIIMLACVAGGLLFLRYSTPLYKSGAKLLIQDEKSSGSSSSLSLLSESTAFNSLFGISSNVYNELGILQTKDLFYKVVKDLNLTVSYYRKGDVRSVELYNKSPFKVNFTPASDTIQTEAFQISFPNNGSDNKYKITNNDLSLSLVANFNDTLKTPIGSILVTPGITNPEEGEDYFFVLQPADEVVFGLTQNLLSTITDDQTTIIGLSYNSNVPKKAEDVLGTLIKEYVQRDVSEKNRISDSSLAFINERVSIVAGELNTIETTIQNFKQKNKLMDISEQAKALIGNSSTYYNQLNEVEVQLSVIKSMLGILSDEKTNNRPIPSTLNNDPTFLSLVERYNAVLMERDRLLLTTTDQNPYIQNLDAQIKNLRSDLAKSLQNQLNAYQISKDKIIAENSLISSTVYNVPIQERTYIGLSREQSVKQALYLYLLQKKEETSITKASNISSASIIETPKTEYQPYFPSKLIVLGASVLLGLIIPTSYIVLKYVFGTVITSREDITNATDCSIMAEIGNSDTTNLFLKENGRSVVAEQFRVFRTNMDFIIGKKKCPRILITSTTSGEGKSFISVNLAEIFALSGKKVLLMEMDLRKPKLSEMLGVGNSKGFSNYIISEQPVSNFIKQVQDRKNVFIMSSGPIPPNPAELLMSASINQMFSELEKNFDIIIIDSPPVGAVADAQILNKHSDVNLYIVRQNYSHKSSLEMVNDILENKKFSNLYLVVNDVKKGASYKYGYSYGYGYGYGSTDKKKKGSLFRRQKTV
jgi:tyrosine-protein kinase Etk/Wzc